MEAHQLLRDPETFPSDKVLQEALGTDAYNTLESFLQTVEDKEYGMALEWRYYQDGKAWLGKLTFKKTICWLSVWKGFFKTSFYFTEKHREAIAALNISETIREKFARTAPSGRLIPLIIDHKDKEMLDDLLEIIRFKRKN